MDMYRADYQSGIKLYVKRVFITDDEKELLPTFLIFFLFIFDSDFLNLFFYIVFLQVN